MGENPFWEVALRAAGEADRMSMKVLYERCAGCDVHKDGVVVHIVVPVAQETRTFRTTTHALLTLVEWLLERKSRMSPWKARASTGSPCITFSKRLSLLSL